MHVRERLDGILGALIGVAGGGMLLGADGGPEIGAAPVLGPEAPQTGDPWADVAAFAIRCAFLLGATIAPVALREIFNRRAGKRRREKE